MFTFHGRSMMLKNLFVQDQPTVLTTLWMALTTGPVLPTDDGTSLPEVNGAGYMRKGVGATSDFWALTAYGVLSNATAVYWDAAGSDWGRVSGWALCTTTLGGLVVAGGEFIESIMIETNGAVALAPGMLVLEVI